MSLLSTRTAYAAARIANVQASVLSSGAYRAAATSLFSTHAVRQQIWAEATQATVDSRLSSSHPSASKVALIDFKADWCGPCHMLSPVLESVVNRAGSEADLLVVDVDKEPQLAQKYEVRAMPTVIAVAGGKEVGRFVGAMGEAKVVDFIKQFQ
ncbi:hypothetical protein OC845_000271 [Tilletia horrida]|nr:hypothetical protein OC845_000271 [Tilletia horrida]